MSPCSSRIYVGIHVLLAVVTNTLGVCSLAGNKDGVKVNLCY